MFLRTLFSENGRLHSVWKPAAGVRSVISGSPISTSLPAFFQSAASDNSNIVFRASLFFGLSSNGEIGPQSARVSLGLSAGEKSRHEMPRRFREFPWPRKDHPCSYCFARGDDRIRRSPAVPSLS